MTRQVFENNHWDLRESIQSASGGSADKKPIALPEKIDDPSTIKHVFLIIRENPLTATMTEHASMARTGKGLFVPLERWSATYATSLAVPIADPLQY